MRIAPILILQMLLCCISVGSVEGQDIDPVSWHIYADRLNDNRYYVKFEARIEKGWAIYSMHSPPGGPVPTSFRFEEDTDATLVRKTREMRSWESVYDQFFGHKVKRFQGEALFIQEMESKIKDTVVKGALTYMACDSIMCLPAKEVPFVVLLN